MVIGLDRFLCCTNCFVKPHFSSFGVLAHAISYIVRESLNMPDFAQSEIKETILAFICTTKLLSNGCPLKERSNLEVDTCK